MFVRNTFLVVIQIFIQRIVVFIFKIFFHKCNVMADIMLRAAGFRNLILQFSVLESLGGQLMISSL